MRRELVIQVCRTFSSVGGGGDMGECNLEILMRLLDKKLSLNDRLGAYDHLDKCKDCREAIYSMARSRDRALFTYRKQRMNLSVA